ncbi:MAG: hypothetical protein DMG66_06590, partial [Acidobacteria bacterium]
AVDMQAAIRSALLNRLSRAPQRFGFAQPREPLAKIFYTTAVETPARHVVEQGLQLAAAIIGQEQLAVDFPLPCDADVESWADQQINGKEFVLLNPGAGWGAKRWPAERYAEVARALSSDRLHALVNCGPGEEELAQQIAAADPEPDYSSAAIPARCIWQQHCASPWWRFMAPLIPRAMGPTGPWEATTLLLCCAVRRAQLRTLAAPRPRAACCR